MQNGQKYNSSLEGDAPTFKVEFDAEREKKISSN